MSVQELKKELSGLSPNEQAEVVAFLFQLRRQADADYQAAIERRLEDKNPAHWVTPEEFEKRLNSN